MRSATAHLFCQAPSAQGAAALLPAVVPGVVPGSVAVHLDEPAAVRWVASLHGSRRGLRWQHGRTSGSGHVTLLPRGQGWVEVVVAFDPPASPLRAVAWDGERLRSAAEGVARSIPAVLEAATLLPTGSTRTVQPAASPAQLRQGLRGAAV